MSISITQNSVLHNFPLFVHTNRQKTHTMYVTLKITNFPLLDSAPQLTA